MVVPVMQIGPVRVRVGHWDVLVLVTVTQRLRLPRMAVQVVPVIVPV